MILNGFYKKHFWKNVNGTRPPPLFMANAIKNFHIFLGPSLYCRCFNQSPKLWEQKQCFYLSYTAYLPVCCHTEIWKNKPLGCHLQEADCLLRGCFHRQQGRHSLLVLDLGISSLRAPFFLFILILQGVFFNCPPCKCLWKFTHSFIQSDLVK